MSPALSIPPLDPSASLNHNAQLILSVRVADLRRYGPIIPDATASEDLHNARIAAKRLRYTLELFPSLYEGKGGNILDKLKLLQEELGLLHDADVRMELIESELASLKSGKKSRVRSGLELILAREQTTRAERHTAVVQLWRKLKHGRIESRLDALARSAH